MKITAKVLKKHGACEDGINDFIKGFGEKGSIDIYDLIDLLHDKKNCHEYSDWLFRKFKLTGVCKDFYINGFIRYIYNYKAGKLDGECKDFHENGNLCYISNYKLGKHDGECKDFYANGNLKHFYNYKLGKHDGECKGFYADGSILYTDIYKEGVLQWT